jgi:hypothetical protein
MYMEMAAVAVGVITAYFSRMAKRISDEMADQMAGRVLSTVGRLVRGDAQVATALHHLQRYPSDPAAAADLRDRIARAAAVAPEFRAALDGALRPTVANAMVIGGGVVVQNSNTGGRVRTRIDQSVRHITRISGWPWLIGGAGVLLAVIVVCAGAGYAVLHDNTTFFDTKTKLAASGGWEYRASEARLRTSPQLEDHGPAKPGFKYLYFDITVENLLDDREAPGIEFHFAREEATLGPDCGAEQAPFLGPVSSYAAGIVQGWCISKNGSLFGGSSCFETNDSLFHHVDRIAPGGRNQVRCVDSYLVADEFDLTAIRVYYVGQSWVSGNNDLPYLEQIPTKV